MTKTNKIKSPSEMTKIVRYSCKNMKIKFCEFIKKAKIGQSFYDVGTGYKYTITKIDKKYTWAKERMGSGHKEWEEIEWLNTDSDKVIF